MVAVDDELAVHAPFGFAENPKGRAYGFDAICTAAGYVASVSGSKPRITLHGGDADFIAVAAGRRTYCIAGRRLPTEARAAAVRIIERLAYGARDWAATEVLRAHRRRVRTASAERSDAVASGQAARDRARRTLPIRRLLRTDATMTDDAIAGVLGLAIPEVAALRREAALMA